MILESARPGATKTRIMYKTYLSQSQLIEYLQILQANSLLTYDQEKRIYRTTEKGIKILNTPNREIVGLMKPKANSQNLIEKTKDKPSFSEPESFYN